MKNQFESDLIVDQSPTSDIFGCGVEKFSEKKMTAPYGISITTFENDNELPTLTHIFWGKTLKDAIHVAESHLKTDYFSLLP